jgi:hypothetical protein
MRWKDIFNSFRTTLLTIAKSYTNTTAELFENWIPWPLRCAQIVKLLGEENVENTRVFDMGCGSVLVGQYLNERGFKHVAVVVVDSSAGM